MGFETNITSFEMARPVVGGMHTLIPAIRLIGRRVMDNLNWAVMLPQEIPAVNEDEFELLDNVAGIPRFHSYGDKVRLPLVQLAVDKRLGSPASEPDFHNLARYISGRTKKPSKRVMQIPEKMVQIALEYNGTTDVDHATARGMGFVIAPAFAKSGYELSLKVDQPERFRRESQAYLDAIRNIRAMKPFMGDLANEDFTIPLAWIAPDMTAKEENGILEDVAKFTQKQYSVQLGGVLPPRVQ